MEYKTGDIVKIGEKGFDLFANYKKKEFTLRGLKGGSMLKRLKAIEKELMEIYAEIQKEIPNLHNLSFEINTCGDTTYQYGYYHIGNDCEQYVDVTELAALVTEAKERRAKNELLYQQFKGIL